MHHHGLPKMGGNRHELVACIPSVSDKKLTHRPTSQAIQCSHLHTSDKEALISAHKVNSDQSNPDTFIDPGISRPDMHTLLRSSVAINRLIKSSDMSTNEENNTCSFSQTTQTQTPQPKYSTNSLQTTILPSTNNTHTPASTYTSKFNAHTHNQSSMPTHIHALPKYSANTLQTTILPSTNTTHTPASTYTSKFNAHTHSQSSIPTHTQTMDSVTYTSTQNQIYTQPETSSSPSYKWLPTNTNSKTDLLSSTQTVPSPLINVNTHSSIIHRPLPTPYTKTQAIMSNHTYHNTTPAHSQSITSPTSHISTLPLTTNSHLHLFTPRPNHSHITKSSLSTHNNVVTHSSTDNITMNQSSGVSSQRLVVAACHLPQGISTPAFPAKTINFTLTQDMFNATTSDQCPPVNLQIKDGYMIAEGNIPLSTWINLLPLAKDVQEESATLTFSHTNDDERTARIIISKEIKQNDTPHLWFSSDVAAHLGLPFLTFAHVNGGIYTCPSCQQQFGAPNPLKVHLATTCKVYPSTQSLTTPTQQQVTSFSSQPWLKSLIQTSTNSALRGSPTPISSNIPFTQIHDGTGRSNSPSQQQITSFSSQPWLKSLIQTSTNSALRGSPTLISSNIPFTQIHDGTGRSNSPSQQQITSFSSQPWLKSLMQTSTNSAVRGSPTPISSNIPFTQIHDGTGRSDSPRHRPASPDSTSCTAPPPSAFRRVTNSSMDTSTFRLSPFLPQPAGTSRDMATPTIHPLLIGPPPSLLLHPQLLLGTVPLPLPNHNFSTSPQTLSMSDRVRGTTACSLGVESTRDSTAEMEALVSNLGRTRRNGHLCLYCGKVYSRKYGLKIHIRTHTGYKPLKCGVCLRPFGDPSNLNKHVRLHAQGHTPYRCGHCGKVLVRRRDLDRHVRSRHPNHHVPHTAESSHSATVQDDDDDDDSDDDDVDVLEVMTPDPLTPTTPPPNHD